MQFCVQVSAHNLFAKLMHVHSSSSNCEQCVNRSCERTVDFAHEQLEFSVLRVVYAYRDIQTTFS
jgi:hypothetical protein